MAKSLFERVRSSRLVDPVRGSVLWDAARATKDSLSDTARMTQDHAIAVRSTRSVPSAKRVPGIVTTSEAHWRTTRPLLDRDVYVHNFELLVSVLDGAGVQWWWVDPVGHRGRRVVAVHAEDAMRVRLALVDAARSATHGAAWRITDALDRRPHYALAGTIGWEDGLAESGV